MSNTRSGLSVLRFFGVLVFLAGPVAAQFLQATSITSTLSIAAGRVVDVVGGPEPDILVAIPAPAAGPFLQTGTIRIYENLGAGAFSLVVDMPVNVDANEIEAADLDGDGDRDLVIGSSPTNGVISMALVFNVGGIFVPIIPAVSLPSQGRIFAVDIDNDGDVDLIRGNVQLLNTGTGVFLVGPPLPASNLPGSAISTFPVDMDSDNDLDLVFLTATPNSVDAVVAFNSGIGTFPTTMTVAGFAPASAQGSLQAADVNGDQFPDLLLSVLGGPAELLVARASIGPAFTILAPVAIAGGPINQTTAGPLALGDFNGDGRMDVALPVVDTAGVRSIHLVKSGTLVVPGLDPAFMPLGITGFNEAGDLDLDGDADLVVGRNSPTTILDIFESVGSLFSGTLLPIGGGDQATSIGVPFVRPLEVIALDDSGLPVAGLVVTFRTTATTVTFPLGATAMTDTNGIAAIVVGGASTGGPANVDAGPIGASTPLASFSLFVRELRSSVTPSSTGDIVTIRYDHERTGVPLIIVADAFPVQIPYGLNVIETRILSPAPGMAVLDGIGVFGPPAPNVVTSPSYVLAVPAPPLIVAGTVLTVQVYGIDLYYPNFPDYVVISNAAPLAF